MELRLITASCAKRYDFVLRSDKMEVDEGTGSGIKDGSCRTEKAGSSIF